MAFKDKIILIIIFIFIIFTFIKNKEFIIFTIGVDLYNCYADKTCRLFLLNNYKKR